jgi:hypothetical protein
MFHNFSKVYYYILFQDPNTRCSYIAYIAQVCESLMLLLMPL